MEVQKHNAFCKDKKSINVHEDFALGKNGS
jgi:hypothetical protein